MPRVTTGPPADRPPASGESGAVTVLQPMNDHGAMTVVTRDGCTREVVEYGSPAVRETLAALPVDTTVHVTMFRLPGRGDAWRVDALGPGGDRPPTE